MSQLIALAIVNGIEATVDWLDRNRGSIWWIMYGLVVPVSLGFFSWVLAGIWWCGFALRGAVRLVAWAYEVVEDLEDEEDPEDMLPGGPGSV